MIKTIDAKIKNVFKSDGKPTNHAPGNWTSYFVSSYSSRLGVCVSPGLLCPGGYDWYQLWMTPSISFDCLYYIHVQQHDSSFDDWQFKNGKYKISLHKVGTKFTLSTCLVLSLAPHFRLLVLCWRTEINPRKRGSMVWSFQRNDGRPSAINGLQNPFQFHL